MEDRWPFKLSYSRQVSIRLELRKNPSRLVAVTTTVLVETHDRAEWYQGQGRLPHYLTGYVSCGKPAELKQLATELVERYTTPELPITFAQ